MGVARGRLPGYEGGFRRVKGGNRRNLREMGTKLMNVDGVSRKDLSLSQGGEWKTVGTSPIEKGRTQEKGRSREESKVVGETDSLRKSDLRID